MGPYERTYGKAYSMHGDDDDKHYDDGDYRSSKQWKRPSYSSKDSKGWKKDSDKYGHAYSYDPYERTYGKAYSMHKDEPKENWKKSDHGSRDWKKNDGKYSSKDEPKGYKGYSSKDEPKGHKYESSTHSKKDYSSKDEPKHEPNKHKDYSSKDEPKDHKDNMKPKYTMKPTHKAYTTTAHPTHSTTAKPTASTAHPTTSTAHPTTTTTSAHVYPSEEPHMNNYKGYSSKDEPKEYKDHMKPNHEQPKEHKKDEPKDHHDDHLSKDDGKHGTAYTMTVTYDNCPDADFDLDGPCDYEGYCEFGQETCCGKTFASKICECAGFRSYCLYTEACYGAKC